MKTCALVLGLLAVPATAYAQINSESTYVEAGVGATLLQDVQTKTYTGVVNGMSDSIKASLSYNPGLTASVEAGYSGFGGGNLRAGISYDYLNITLRRARVVGVIGGTLIDESATGSELKAFGLNFDNSAHVLGGNVYFNLPLIGDNIVPYIGAGGGVAIIQNANAVPAASATAGLRFAIGPSVYFGLRYRLHYMEGPKDSIGIQYEPVVSHTISAVIGAYTN